MLSVPLTLNYLQFLEQSNLDFAQTGPLNFIGSYSQHPWFSFEALLINKKDKNDTSSQKPFLTLQTELTTLVIHLSTTPIISHSP